MLNKHLYLVQVKVWADAREKLGSNTPVWADCHTSTGAMISYPALVKNAMGNIGFPTKRDAQAACKWMRKRHKPNIYRVVKIQSS